MNILSLTAETSNHSKAESENVQVICFLPEEGVVLNADFPQSLGSSVIGKLKTNCTFKLLILEGREKDTGTEREKQRRGGYWVTKANTEIVLTTAKTG